MERPASSELSPVRLCLCEHDEDARARACGCQELAEWLGRRSQVERLHAATALRDYGPCALEPLFQALKDPDARVRVAAAESLGYIGDERAVQPLAEALRAGFVGRSARRQLMIGLLVLAGGVLLPVAFVWGTIALKFGAGGIGVLIGHLARRLLQYYKQRRAQSRVSQKIAEALARIAERSPTPELRTVLPDLNDMAADLVQQERGARTASRQAAARIESLTERLKSLPMPAAGPGPATDALPVPASAPVRNADTLPRVHGGSA